MIFENYDLVDNEMVAYCLENKVDCISALRIFQLESFTKSKWMDLMKKSYHQEALLIVMQCYGSKKC